MSGTPWLWIPAVVLAALLLGAGWRLSALRSGAWSAAAIILQASALALIKAGPLVGYQHYTGLAEAARARPVPLVLATFVVTMAVTGLVRRRRAVRSWVRARSSAWQIVVAVMVACLLAAAPSASASAYAGELALAAVIQLSAMTCLVFAAVQLPDELTGQVDRWLTHVLESAPAPPRPERAVWIMAAFVTVLSAILSLVSYQAIPHIPDEIAYLLQARYYAVGQPWMTPPPVPAAFDTFLLEVSGERWYGVFPPGWPLVLAAGVRLGAPFLVNPVLGGVCVLLTYLLVLELADRPTARVTTFLLAVSPWHLLMSMSFMSHVLSLALALLTAWGTARAWRTGAWRPALAAGISLGVLGMSRPLEGVVVGLLAGVPLLIAAVRGRRFAALAAGTVGTAITGVLGLAYNRMITGSAFIFPAERLFDREYGPGRYSIGFGPEKGVGWTGLDPFPGHGAVDVVVNWVLNGFMLNVDLFGWVVGSAAIVTFGVLRSRKGVERLMAVAILMVVALHAAFWFSGGPDFGARYWYLIIVPCALLAGRALAAPEAEQAVVPGGRTAVATGILCLAALTVYVPWRAADKYHHYRSVRPDLVRMKDDATYDGGLILVSGRRHPDWAGAALANEVNVGGSSSPVFAWDRDPATRQAVLDAFPARPVWLVRGPSETGGGFEIVRGPIAPAERAALSQP